MAHYLPHQPRVYRYNNQGIIESQYEVWPNPEEEGLLGWDAVIINRRDTEPDKLPFKSLQRAFAKFHETPLASADIDLGNEHVRHFRAYLAEDLQSWPQPKPPENPDRKKEK